MKNENETNKYVSSDEEHPHGPEEFEDPPRIYLEFAATLKVANRYQRIAIVVMAAVILVQSFVEWKIYDWARHEKMVVRIDEVGAATAVNYGTFEYKPQDREVRHFLIQFVTKHFGRVVATMKDEFAESLYFLDKTLADRAIEQERRDQALAKFIREGSQEVDIKVINVSLQELRTPPFKATVSFDEITYSSGTHMELRRVRYEGTFEFIVREDVPNEWIPFNPLGLIITYFRVDPAFLPTEPN